jgi:4,5-DOPA dioxygenase extradiol
VSSSSTAAADALVPADHPFAAHLRRVTAAEAARPHRPWSPADGPLPSLYLSHGGGPMPFQMDDWLGPLHDWARALPKPRAILVVSAHWESAPLALSSSRPGELV